MLSKSGVKVGIALPQGFRDGAIDLALVREYALAAEAAGFDDLWTMEQITGRHAFLEPVTLLAYLSSITERIRLGTAVLVTNLRNPIQLAKAVGTLDHLSGGRLTLGIGLGTNTRMYAAYGLPDDRRVARFIESINVMKALWTQENATLEGNFWPLASVPMEPKPVQKPHPPLWFGAHTEAAQQRAIRHGDGWMGAGSTDIEEFFVELDRVKHLLAETGRDASNFPLSKRVYLSIDDDEVKARERMNQQLGDFYGTLGMRLDDISWAICGPASKVLETLHRMREAGLTHLMLHPAPLDIRHLDLIATQIAPEL
jgi:probable F420-dependent oxidoreductase